MEMLKRKAVETLRATEKYTKTDMVYVAKGGFWLAISQFLAATVAFLFSLVVARYVSLEIYGLYKYVFSVAAIVSTLSLTGLSTVVVNRVARGDSAALVRSFRLSLWTAWPAALVFIMYAAYSFARGEQNIAVFFLVCSIAQPLSNAASLYISYLNGVQDFKRTSLYPNHVNAASVLATGIVAYLYGGFVAMALTSLTVTTIGNVLAYLKVRPKTIATSFDSKTSDYRSGLHLSAMNILGAAAQHIDKIVTFHLLGPVSVALYSFASAMPDQIRGLLKIIARLAQPRLARGDFSTIQTSLGIKILRASIFALAMTVAYIALAPLLFNTLFPTYAEAVPYSQFLAISIVATLGALPLTALQSHEKTGTLYRHTIWTCTTQIASTLILTISFGLWGTVISTVLNRMVSFGLSIYALKASR